MNNKNTKYDYITKLQLYNGEPVLGIIIDIINIKSNKYVTE